MFTRFIVLLILFVGLLIQNGYSSQITDQIRIRLESDQPGEKIEIRGTSLKSIDEIQHFYVNRNFEEIWSNNGILTELAYEMRFEIYQSQFDGLNPKNYNIELIELFFSTFESNKKSRIVNNPGDVADLDLLLSDAFFYLSRHLEIGKIDPASLKSYWEITSKTKKLDYGSLLTEGYHASDIRRQLEKLYPDFAMYRKGREVLRALDERRKVDTLNWKRIKIDKSIKAGDANNSIPVLRQRLKFWGYLNDYPLISEKHYDSTMWLGVKSFQKNNGMEADGVIGSMTGQALNASPRDLMDKAAVNLERLRWLPDTVKTGEFILVNIANYQLDYLSNLDTLLSARVIVGKQYHESPIFTAEMSYLVFSPYWNIPYSITKNEIMPSVRRNPNYLNQKNMEVVTNSGKVVDPKTINWSSKSFPYMVRQKPGGSNSLGLVKFMFPNKHSVYIHDTPARTLFSKEDRALSHGCIRIEKPTEFAELILRNDPSWTSEKINTAMHQTKEIIVTLDRKIPVIILYLTFWADSKGKGHFRPDIYERDPEVLAALRN
jgi:murein L,D-transpeptidase YcbB/YkuD